MDQQDARTWARMTAQRAADRGIDVSDDEDPDCGKLLEQCARRNVAPDAVVIAH